MDFSEPQDTWNKFRIFTLRSGMPLELMRCGQREITSALSIRLIFDH